MKRNINFNHLYYFWVVAKEGSINRAASALRLAQPTISSQLKSLEFNLGATLFDRKGRRMELNQNGKTALKYCDYIFTKGTELFEIFEGAAEFEINFVKIGIIPSVSKHLIYKLIADLFKDTNVRTTIVENESKYLIEELESGHIDIVFSDFAISLGSKSLFAKEIFERSFLLICNNSLKKRIDSQEINLESVPVINYTDNSILHDQIQKYFHQNEFNAVTISKIDDIELIKLVVKDNEVMAILPRLSVEQELKNDEFRVLREVSGIESSLYLYFRDDNTNPSINNVIKKIVPE